MEALQLIRDLTALHGPSGNEGEVAKAIAKLAKPYADQITTDTLGNLIVHKKGKGPKVLFAAHMDTLGVVVTHIEKEGCLRFGKLGGMRASDILYTPVQFQNGVRGAIGADDKADKKALKIDDLFIDIGAADREEAAKLVQVGDTAVYATAAAPAGKHRVVSPYLDNRVSCAVLLLALERLGKSDNDLYFAFTVQEEVGCRGGKTAVYGVDPEYGVAVDVTGSFDLPRDSHGGSSVLGGGAAIKVMDDSVICQPEMVEKLAALAKKGKIRHQMDVLTTGGTDAGPMHQSRSGVLTGGISVPCRYIHTPTELADLDDVEACVQLVTAFAQAKL